MFLLGFALSLLPATASMTDAIELSTATVVVHDGRETSGGYVAATVLVEELEKRTGIRLPVSTRWPESGPVIEIVAGKKEAPRKFDPLFALLTKPESYGISTTFAARTPPSPDASNIMILGADARGALFGVGHLLRKLEWRQGSVTLPAPLNVTCVPEYPIRGHQLGYRATANSYDAWDPAQYDQYIRELALFGTNAIEAIPVQDERPIVGKTPREEMDAAMSTICDKYGLAFWVWTPATFDLNDQKLRAESLAEFERLYKQWKRLDAVFFPGGDPGDNPANLVMPYLDDLSAILAKHHPKAKIWVSLQGFDETQVDAFYAWVNAHHPVWMGGVVAGPSSPSIRDTRVRLSSEYGIRHYPDITHVVRAQYPAHWIDPAFAFTLGREPVNPRPVFYRTVHNNLAPYTSGFLTYSDGIHDDVNKFVWSALGWDTQADLREVLMDYSRLFFGPDVAQGAADGIFALERNWEGSLALNGAVDATLAHWQGLEATAPQLAGNWRWQMNLLRANYDAYVRHRLIHETALEEEANARMLEAASAGANYAMDAALAALQRADTEKVRPELRQRVEELCAALWKSIGFQTSVEKYQAIAPERGAVLDYVDYPLNNRWWLEDEIAKARGMATEEEKVAHLRMLAMWEHPGPGSFYDDIGNVAQSSHVIRSEPVNSLVEPDRATVPDFMWWDSGKRRVRQSWMSKMDWPEGLRYLGLDPEADYVLRTTGLSQCQPRANGERLAPTLDGKEIGEIKEFPIPKRLHRERVLTITFDVPYEPGINWRQASRLSEAWLIRK
ncbi:MAG: hypothetical protein IT364_05740 [Candidatus Hydrogenedentes bacterium]|nr:hypothetical protein [Candidatus Hydrogenedentota bacterium]